MPSIMESKVRSTGKFLIAASLPFFLGTAFEMYVLTPAQGPQMLFYSLAHTFPPLLLVVWLSGIAFVCLAVFAVSVLVSKMVGVLHADRRYVTMMLLILLVQAAHAALLLTYDRWAAAVFS
jgi:hypothetical protein